MRLTTLVVLAAMAVAAPVHALEIECDQDEAKKAAAQRTGGSLLDEDMVRKRRETREADLARAKERMMRSQSAAQPPVQAETSGGSQ